MTFPPHSPRSPNDIGGVLNRLIEEFAQDRVAVRDLTREMRADREQVAKLSGAVENLTAAIGDERKERRADTAALKEADYKLNARIARIAREQAWRVGPWVAAAGAALGWMLMNGPQAVRDWVELFGGFAG